VKDWILAEAESDERLMDWLKNKRVDYVLTDLFAGPILAKNVGVNARALRPLAEVLPLYLTFNFSQGALAARYDKMIDEMIKDGTLDKIYLRYLPFDYNEARRQWVAQ
jgi:polar amino acid transport system substrate-binding protein